MAHIGQEKLTHGPHRARETDPQPHRAKKLTHGPHRARESA